MSTVNFIIFGYIFSCIALQNLTNEMEIFQVVKSSLKMWFYLIFIVKNITKLKNIDEA